MKEHNTKEKREKVIRALIERGKTTEFSLAFISLKP